MQIVGHYALFVINYPLDVAADALFTAPSRSLHPFAI